MKSILVLSLMFISSISFASHNRRTVEVAESILNKVNTSGELQYIKGCKFLLKSHNELCGSEELKTQMLERISRELPIYSSELSAKDLDRLTAEIAALVTPGWDFSDKRDIAERWSAKQIRLELRN